MAIAIPSLDDRVYADLVSEARTLIPVYDPSWTNHNESDPGITLMELFAWLTELQIYALDQITDEHRLTFLRLLNGPDLVAKRNADGTIDQAWLEQETVAALDRMRQPMRAVSALDHETLALRASPDVQRARCIPRRNLAAGNEDMRRAEAPGHVSVVIVPRRPNDETQALCDGIYDKMKPVRTLTTKLHIVLPVWAPIATRIMVARRSDVPEDTLRDRIQKRLAAWLDPRTGGNDGTGWPFDRDVYVSELNAVLEGVPGVDYVGETLLDSAASDDPALEQAAQPIWHDSGMLIGRVIAAHHLPRSKAADHAIVIAGSLDPVSITVTVTPGTGKTAQARQAVMQTLREYLWSLQSPQGFSLSEGRIRTQLYNSLQVMAAVSNIGAIAIDADPAKKDKTADTAVYVFKPGEFFFAVCTVDTDATPPAGGTL